MRSVLADCRFVTYKSPLSQDLVGAAVLRDDRTLGVAWDIEAAAAKCRAIGEAVERVALEHDHRAFAVHTAVELGDRALPLKDAVRFSPGQLTTESLARYRWTAETPTSWAAAARLEAPSEHVLVPADLAFFRRLSADTTLIRPVSSTGTAAHPSRDQALLRALVECVERHEIAVAYRRGSAPVRLHLDEYHVLNAIAGLFEAEGAQLEVGLLSVSFGIPVAVAAVVSSRVDRPSIAVGSGAGLDVVSAMLAATFEAIQVFHLAWQLLRRGATVPAVPHTSQERALWWGTRHVAFAERLFRDAAPVQPWVALAADAKTSSANAERLVALVRQDGHPGAVLDITPACFRLGGPHVTRVVLPSLLLPHTDERYPFMMAPCDPGAPVTAIPHPYA